MHLTGKHKIVKTGGRIFVLFASPDSADGFHPFSINETGARLLALLEEERSLEELLAALEAEYAVEGASLRRDVDEYLARLTALGILEGYNGAAPAGENGAL